MPTEIVAYLDGRRREGSLALDDAPGVAKEPGTFVWVHLHGADPETVLAVQRAFDLPELAVEDALHAHQRAKLDLYDDSLFAVLKTVTYIDATEDVEVGEVMAFLGDGYLVSLSAEPAVLERARRRVEGRPDLLSLGPGAALYGLLDAVVDEYLPVAAEIDADVSAIEDEVFDPGRQTSVQRIYELKREVLEFARAVAPLRGPAAELAAGRVPHVHSGLTPFLADVEDHLARVVMRADSFRDLLTSVLEANLAQVGVQQNEDMRKISAWVAIAAVPTLLAGIYGMNFDYMPELDDRYSYPVLLLVMVLICLGLYRKFRSSGWL
jgi:magnesium transporter